MARKKDGRFKSGGGGKKGGKHRARRADGRFKSAGSKNKKKHKKSKHKKKRRGGGGYGRYSSVAAMLREFGYVGHKKRKKNKGGRRKHKRAMRNLGRAFAFLSPEVMETQSAVEKLRARFGRDVTKEERDAILAMNRDRHRFGRAAAKKAESDRRAAEARAKADAAREFARKLEREALDALD